MRRNTVRYNLIQRDVDFFIWRDRQFMPIASNAVLLLHHTQDVFNLYDSVTNPFYFVDNFVCIAGPPYYHGASIVTLRVNIVVDVRRSR